MEQLQALRRAAPEAWNDSTDWQCVLAASAPAEALYIQRSLSAADDRLRRAAACVAVLRNSGGCSSAVVAPLRVGPVATDSVETFTALLHAAKAGAELKSAVADGKTPDERMGHAGRAWRHLNAAGPWMHERSCCPPQLLPAFKSKLTLVILLLTYHRIAARAPDTRGEAACMRQVAMLHAIIEHCKAANLPRVGEWAATELEPLLAHCWAVYHRDPRRRDDDNAPQDATVAYAVCRLLGSNGGATVQHFLREHGTVVGGNHTRDAEVRRTGAVNLVRPLLSTSELETRALPLQVLDGKATLDGERPFTTVAALPPGDDRHDLVLSGIGVALPTTALPRIPRPRSTWLPSFGMPALPKLARRVEPAAAAAQPPPADAALFF